MLTKYWKGSTAEAVKAWNHKLCSIRPPPAHSA